MQLRNVGNAISNAFSNLTGAAATPSSPAPGGGRGPAGPEGLAGNHARAAEGDPAPRAKLPKNKMISQEAVEYGKGMAKARVGRLPPALLGCGRPWPTRPDRAALAPCPRMRFARLRRCSSLPVEE